MVRGVAARIVAVSSMDVYRACGVLHRLEPGPLEPLPLTEASPLRTSTHTTMALTAPAHSDLVDVVRWVQ